MWRSLSTVLRGRQPLLGEVQVDELPSIEPDAPPAPVPVVADLAGLTLSEARRLGRLGGQQVFVVERSTSRGLWGRVLEQEPLAGQPYSPDGMLVLTVGARPHVFVPDVRGRDEDDALSMLREAGLGTARRAARQSERVPEGHVIRTRPRAGAAVPAGSLVSYIVAREPRHVRSSRQRERRHPRSGHRMDVD